MYQLLVLRKLGLAIALCGMLVASLIQPVVVSAKIQDIPLIDPMPEGVSFQTLASGDGRVFRFHVGAVKLHHIDVQCGEATGRIAGVEQITYVEHGEVDVRDWATKEVITTLHAGDSYSPQAEGEDFFLASPKGREGSVYHFSAGASGTVGQEIPDITYKITDCGSGANSVLPASPATVTTIWDREVQDSLPDSSFTMYVGLLTVAPGAALGRSHVESATGEFVHADNPLLTTANGTGLLLMQSGSFGKGDSSGLEFLACCSEFTPGMTATIYANDRLGLENFGPVPAVAMIFGVVPTGSPILSPE